MAYFNNATQNNNQSKNLIGYMNNLSIVDANGKHHRVGLRGVPLQAQNALHEALVKAAEATPDKVFTLSATVKPYTVEEIDADSIEL